MCSRFVLAWFSRPESEACNILQYITAHYNLTVSDWGPHFGLSLPNLWDISYYMCLPRYRRMEGSRCTLFPNNNNIWNDFFCSSAIRGLERVIIIVIDVRESTIRGQWESWPETGLIWESIRWFGRRVVLAGVLLFNTTLYMIFLFY